MSTRLYKRDAKGKPLVWEISKDGDTLVIHYGLVGHSLHRETINVTLKNANEMQSRINAKRKEGYKEITELKDNAPDILKKEEDFAFVYSGNPRVLLEYLNSYLPKYSTTSEGFVLPMLAKVLEDNKPFDKYGTMLGQWKIDGLRCIIGAEKAYDDLFNTVYFTYHSRIGEDWTSKMKWMDDILRENVSEELIDMMVEEGACLDGELYLPGYPVNDINSFVKNEKLPQHYQLQYWCYDIACENMSAEERRLVRVRNLRTSSYFGTKNEHLNCKSQFVTLPSYDIRNIVSATEHRNVFINLGFEGLILRNPASEYQFGKRNQAMFKFKKVDDGKFQIVDIIPEHKRANLPIFVCRNDINEELFECSINKPQSVQEEYLINKNEYIDKYMLVEYRSRSGVNQLPFHARGIDIVSA